jgi:hypothetical protein
MVGQGGDTMNAGMPTRPDRVERATWSVLMLALIAGVIWALVQGDSAPFGLDTLLR